MVLPLVLLAGCGGSDKNAVSVPTTSTTQATTSTRTAKPAPRRRVTVPLPRELKPAPKAVSPRSWPRPVKVYASFPIDHTSANVSCPLHVLESMPPDGVYVAVSEYRNPPKGIPPESGLGPRPDLSKLDIRDEEVECWNGPGGFAKFREHGRGYRVEVLLGRKVTAAKRRRVLDALGRLRLG
jgi:hypothetical protein